MSKENQKIIVVEKNILFDKNYFQGFREHHEINYELIILSNLKTMRRGYAEKDPTHKQPIAYVLIADSKTKSVFAYQRSKKDEEYNESRLQGKWSWGIGGHIDASDYKTKNPIRESMLRELSEEIEIIGKRKEPIVLGYINDDSNSVGEVHFGILYVVEIDGEVNRKDSEIAQGKFKTINELEEICASQNFDVETWSQIALEPLKKYFENP